MTFVILLMRPLHPSSFFFFNDTATTEIYTLSLHDALPICVQHRGGRGIITLKRSDKTGAIVALKEVLPEDELMMITKKGIMIRVPVEGIRISGRNTQGVKVMNLTPGDLVVDVARVVKEDDAENGDDGDDEEDAPAPKKAAAPKKSGKKKR